MSYAQAERLILACARMTRSQNALFCTRAHGLPLYQWHSRGNGVSGSFGTERANSGPVSRRVHTLARKLPPFTQLWSHCTVTAAAHVTTAFTL